MSTHKVDPSSDIRSSKYSIALHGMPSVQIEV